MFDFLIGKPRFSDTPFRFVERGLTYRLDPKGKVCSIIHNMKKLVAYFSASGVTREAARDVAESCGADLFEIKPEVPYTDEDLDWMDKKSRSTLEMKDESSRPAYVKGGDFSDYDEIIVGFPVWWDVEPRVVDTFLDDLDLRGKTLIPFVTSGGSGINGSQRHLESLYPEANWKKGKRLRYGEGKSFGESL